MAVQRCHGIREETRFFWFGSWFGIRISGFPDLDLDLDLFGLVCFGLVLFQEYFPERLQKIRELVRSFTFK